MTKTMSINLKESSNAIVVGNINKLRESVASMFTEPIQVSDDVREPAIEWGRIKLVVLIDRTCTASLKNRWEAAAKEHGIPVVGGDDKSTILKRIEQRFEVVNEEPKPPAPPEAKKVIPPPVQAPAPAPAATPVLTGLSGLLEEAQKLTQAKDEAEALALKAMERADRLQGERDSLQDLLAAAQAKIHVLETLPDADAIDEERLEEEVAAHTKELKKQLAAANHALQEKERQLRKSDERAEKAKEEVIKANEEAKSARSEMTALRSEKLRQLDRRGQLLIAMNLFSYIIPLTEDGIDDDVLQEFEKAVQILFEHPKIQQGASQFLTCFGNLVRNYRVPGPGQPKSKFKK